ncbi:MAG: U32 family peptidase [Nitrospirae bacterium]|nr:U32 family peptidase [Nitrospirota bacterium]
MTKIEICAPAGNLPSVKAAVDNGADAIYMGFSGDTNLRNFPALNLTDDEVYKAIQYAHGKNKRVFITVNAYPQEKELPLAYDVVDKAYSYGADAVIASDIAVLSYARTKYPGMRLHLSVQASASNVRSIEFFRKHFGIKRVVLPRVLTLDEIRELRDQTDIEIEIFALGLLCINSEGQCFLSSYITSESINTYGACSHPKFINFEEDADNEGEGTLKILSNNVLLNKYSPMEEVAYPTPCKGKYYNKATDKLNNSIQDPESLNVIEILPEIIQTGINSIKIEGRQRSRSYVEKVVSTFREAVDNYYSNSHSVIDRSKRESLQTLFEGLSPSYGCYKGK